MNPLDFELLELQHSEHRTYTSSILDQNLILKTDLLITIPPKFLNQIRTCSDSFQTLVQLLTAWHAELCFGKFLQVIRYVFLAKKLKNSQKRLLCVIRHKNRVCQSWWKVTLWWPPISERTINVLCCCPSKYTTASVPSYLFSKNNDLLQPSPTCT